MSTLKPSRTVSSRLPTVVQILLSVAALLVSSFSPVLIQVIGPLRQLAVENPASPVVIAAGWISRILPLVVALMLLAAILRLDGTRTLRSVGWRWDRRSPAALGLGIGLAAVAVLGAAWPLNALGLTRVVDLGGAAGGTGGLPVWTVLVAQLLLIVTQQGVPEELIFRGYLLRSLRMSPMAAIIVSSLAFGVLHLISSGGQQNVGERFLYLMMPLGFGFLAAVLTIRLDSLWAAIGVHVGFHLATRAGMMAGLGDGPWLWVASGLLFLLIGAVAWRWRAARPPAGGEPTRPADPA